MQKLLQIHESLDRDTRELSARQQPALNCRRGCADCCVDDLTIFEVEAQAIRERYGDLLRDGAPHPAGRCAFLDGDDGCRVYDARPYVCRTQGLPLRWLTENEAGERVEYRDICPLNETTESPITELDADLCWTLGPTEGQLAELQATTGRPGKRVALRDLFDRSR